MVRKITDADSSGKQCAGIYPAEPPPAGAWLPLGSTAISPWPVVSKCALREGRQRERSAQVIPGRSRFGSLLLVNHRPSSLCHSATNEPQSMQCSGLVKPPFIHYISVNRQNQKAHRLPPVVTPCQMRLFMSNHRLHGHYVHVGGQIDFGPNQSQDKRRLYLVAQEDVSLIGYSFRNAPAYPHIADAIETLPLTFPKALSGAWRYS